MQPIDPIQPAMNDEQSMNLTQDEMIQVNHACNHFEQEWKNGRQPKIESLLEGLTPHAHKLLLGELLPLEIAYRRSSSRPLDIEECKQRFPNDDAAWLAEIFAANAEATQDHPSPIPNESSEPPIERIGNYELLEQIGEGGFGIVYRAEQRKPVRRLVALKVMKPGMDSKQIIARFEAERQALAIMNHPNIASVFDAGMTDTGRPYFVMELVRGVPITEYCDQCKLTVEERLKLFVSVCQAVQHAHQKGVIHRDIKPTNVLVAIPDGVPSPKIIDFGVAKAINQRLTEQTLRTGFAQMLGTPLYMSPEQAEMSVLDVDTRSDIYSLGILLYELLTGSTPIEKSRLENASFDKVRRLIREDEPPLPSTRLSTIGAVGSSTIAERRRMEPIKFAQSVRGDLDWIAMKALEKDRTRRYSSAAELADDVRRHLEDRPVEAGAPTLLYRAHKFTRRNKAVITAAAFVSTCLILASLVSLWQASRAMKAQRESESARRHTQAVVDFLLSTFRSPDPSVDGHDVTVVELLDRAVADLPSKFPEDSPEKANMLHTLGETYLGLGLPTKATNVLKRAHSIREEQLGKHNAATLETNLLLGKAYTNLGRLTDATRFAKAAIDKEQKSAASQAAAHEATKMLAELFAANDRYDEAVEWRRRSYATHRQNLGADHPETLESMDHLADALISLGKFDEGIDLRRLGVELRTNRMGATHLSTLNSQFDLAKAYWDTNRFEKAIATTEETIEASRKAFGPNHAGNVKLLEWLGAAYREAGQNEKAITAYEEALQADMSKEIRLILLHRLGDTQYSIRDLSGAIESYREACDGWRELDAKSLTRPMVLRNLATVLGETARWSEIPLLLEEQLPLEYKESRASLAIVRLSTLYAWLDDDNARIRLSNRILDKNPTDLTFLERTVKPLLMHPTDSAPDLMERAYAIAFDVSEGAEGHRYESYFKSLRAMKEYRTGNFQEAIRWLETPILPDNQGICRIQSLYFLSMAQFQLGDKDAGAETLAQADRLVNERLPKRDSKVFPNGWQEPLLCFLLQDEAHALAEENHAVQ